MVTSYRRHELRAGSRRARTPAKTEPIQAAESCAFRELSVSKSLWADAQKVMGLWPAALAVMVVSAKEPEYFSRTPAHYFAGMVAKAKNGTLRLDRSIWGLRSRNDDTGKA
jgi:hypothetical protein